MKKLNLLLLIIVFSCNLQVASATNPISVESYGELMLEAEQEAGFFQKAKAWVTAAMKPKTVKTLAILSLILGVASLVGLFVFIFATPATGSVLTIALAALAADILAIIVLARTGKNRKENRKSRIMAILGLITGLLTGLLPLAVLIAVLIALN